VTAPVRLRLSRARGFDLQALSRATNGLEAVKVDRSTRWGSPLDFRRADHCWTALAFGCRGDARGRREASVKAFREWVDPGDNRKVMQMQLQPKMGSGKKFVKLGPGVDVGEAPAIDDIVAALRGKNLACWCKPGFPCHADVLLDLANRPTCEEVA